MMTQIITFNVKPEHYDSLRTALIEDKRNAEQEEGVVEIRLFTDPQKPNIIFSYEPWKDQDALDYHREHPYTVKSCRLLDTTLTSPLETLNLTEIRPPTPQTVEDHRQLLFQKEKYDAKKNFYHRGNRRYRS